MNISNYIVYKEKNTGKYYQDISPNLKLKCWHSGKIYKTLQNCDDPNDNIVIKSDNLINFELHEIDREVKFSTIVLNK